MHNRSSDQEENSPSAGPTGRNVDAPTPDARTGDRRLPDRRPGMFKSFMTSRTGNDWVHALGYHTVAPRVIIDAG